MAARGKTPQKDSGEYLTTVQCRCGKKHGAYLKHYQLLRASCGVFFWALQPKRGGPLVLFPHPGFVFVTP